MKQKLSVAILVFVLFISLFPTAYAAGEGTSGDYLRDIGSKLYRGVKNILISPGEIGCGVVKDTENKGVVGVATGFGKGTVFMLRRILVGATETASFVIPAEETLPGLCQG